jgi:RNA recognition motif-containing protein
MDYYQSDGKSQSRRNKEKPINTKKFIYLGDLPPNTDQYEIVNLINSYGQFQIESINMNTGKDNKSYAFIKFKSTIDATKVIELLNMKEFKNHIIKAKPFTPYDNNEKTNNSNANLFVKNLPNNINEKELYNLFKEFGKINSINLKTNHKGESLGYGYVLFDNEESAKNAIENMNNKEINGKNLQVDIFKNKEKRNENKDDNCNIMLIIKNISPNKIDNEKTLSNYFETYGQILICGILLPNDINKLDSRSGVILFNSQKEADSAYNELKNDFDIEKRPIDDFLIEQVKKQQNENRKEKYSGCNLVIKNLPKEIGDKELLDLFKQFGKISSARVATENVWKEKKNENGDVIDKFCVYESKGLGFVLFKSENDAAKAKETLNEKNYQYLGYNLKLNIEDYDYNKGEKKHFQNLSHNMGFDGYNNNNFRGGRGGKRGGKKFHHNNNTNNFNNNFNNNRMYNNYNNFNNNKNNMNFPNNLQFNNNTNNNNNINDINNMNAQFNLLMNQNNTNTNNNIKITVENYNLVEKVKKNLEIEDPEQRTEALGETIFFFLLHFIPAYGLNITNGKSSDSDISSKLTGILIKTDTNNLFEIISKNDKLVHSLKDVILKLIHTKSLES